MVTKSLLLTVQVAAHLAYMVVIPLAIFGGLGLYLDRRLETLPLYLLIGIGIAFAVTLVWMRQRLRAIIVSLISEK